MITPNEENGEETPQFTALQADEILAFTFKNSIEPIVIVKHQRDATYIIHSNNTFSKTTGYDSQELMGMDFLHLFSEKNVTSKLNSFLKKSKVSELEVLCVRKDGTEFWTKISKNPIPNTNDGDVYSLLIVQDISTLKREILQKKLLSEISQLFSKNKPLPSALSDLMKHLVTFGNLELAEIWLLNADSTTLNLAAFHASKKKLETFYSHSQLNFRKGEGLPGKVWGTGKEVIWENIDSNKSFIRFVAAKKVGLKSALGLPLIDNNTVIGVLVFFTDNAVSALEHHRTFFKELELSLGAQLKRILVEDDFRQLVQSSPDILCIAGSDGKFIKVNPSFCELLEYSEEELTSRPFTDFLHPDDQSTTVKEYKATISNKRKAKGFVNRYLTKSGETKWISWDSSTIHSQNGSSFAYGKDITEQKELEDLLDNASRLARIGGWEIDLISKTVYWSALTYEIHEVDETFTPTIEAIDNFYHEEFSALIQEKITAGIKNKTQWEFEVPLITQAGNEKWVKVVGQAKYKRGKYVGSYGSIQDIHERKSTELLLKNTADNIPGAIFQYMIRPDGTDVILQMTKGAYDLWHLSPEQCTADSNLIWNQTKGGGDYDLVMETIKRSAETMEDWYCQYRSKLPTGDIVWHEGFGKPTKLKDGTVLWDSLIIDITLQRKSQVKLEESIKALEDYKFALDESAIIAITNKKGEIISVNDNFCKTSKFEREELIGNTHRIINSGYHDKDFFVNLWQTIAQGKVWRGEIKNKAKDGSYYWVDTTIVPFLDHKKRPFQYLAIRFDITDRKLADEQIIQSNERFEKVAQATNDAIWDWDIVGESLYRGSGFKELFGIEVNLKIASEDFWKDKFHPEDLPRIIESLEDAISNPKVSNWSQEYRIIQENGSIATVVDRGIIIRNNHGKALRMVGAITDITHRKEYEQSLMQLNASLSERAKELAISNAELEQFAFVASHDLQEPLRMVTSFLTQLEKKYGDSLDDNAKKYIHFAVDGAKRMREVILNLLDFSQVGKHKDDIEPISLERVIQETLNLQARLIEERRAQITFDDLPVVNSYYSPLLQIFQNLIGNAMKYAKNDVPAIIYISALELESSWQISIKDNGIGIDSEYHEKIFVLFQRLHHQEEYSGTGIGLAVVKKIIDGLGGEIWVESAPDKGSTFYFTLPKTIHYETNTHPTS